MLTWQGAALPVGTECRGGHRPDKPCQNPVAGVMHVTGGLLAACELHMHKSMTDYRRETGR